MFVLLILSTGVFRTYSFLGVLLRNSHTRAVSLKTWLKFSLMKETGLEILTGE